jgi:fimbrial isopeptide formation D2 family protein/uncharacterized repeat protein (TIGR01451 family)
MAASTTLVTTTVADWDPEDGHKMHYPQLPDPFGWDVDATYVEAIWPQIILADDWMCSETGPVEDIHFWGSWLGDNVGTITAFAIAIHADIPANPPDIPYSRPGEKLWERMFSPGEWIEAGPWEGPQGWYDPAEGYIPENHFLYWQYNIEDIPDPFIQEVGTIYWLAISAIVMPQPEPFQPRWGWKSSQDHWNDDACWSYWYEPFWIDLWEPPDFTQSLDLAFVITGGEEEEPCVDIEKKVWDEDSDAWVEEIDADVCTNVEFKITVHNCGNPDLINLRVMDYLPDCLEYVDGSSTVDGNPQEPGVNGNQLTWTLPGPLKYCNYITIRFKAHVISPGENVNYVKINADTPSGGSAYDHDTAIVNGIGAASIYVDKKVSKDGGATWSDEVNATVCTTVRFRITAHNDGDYDLTNIKVVDTLPDCLEYKDNATPKEPVISGNQLTWTFPGPLTHCNTITIEFDAHVKTEGENENKVTVTADYSGGTVSGSDTAVVHATPANNPPLKPATPYKKIKSVAQKSYTLCTKTTDPDGDQVFYWWDFGDGNNSGWDGPHNSGDQACITHSYEKGTYTIKVKAKDVHNAESPWSDPFTLSVSKGKSVNLLHSNFFLQRLIDFDRFPLLGQLLQLLFFNNIPVFQ